MTISRCPPPATCPEDEDVDLNEDEDDVLGNNEESRAVGSDLVDHDDGYASLC